MLKKIVAVTGLGLALASGSTLAQSSAQSSTVTCADLNWSAEVLARNPDVAETCRAVYEKDGRLFAQMQIEVIRTRGNTMTFRTLHTDGTRGDSRSVTMDPGFRAQIGGRSYRVSDLNRGQQLNVYLPEDRFALIMEDEDGPDHTDAVAIEDATVMPTTASPLFLIGLAGGVLFGLGGIAGAMRRRLS